MGEGGASPGPVGVLQCESAGLDWPSNIQTPCAGLPRRLQRGACAGAQDEVQRTCRRLAAAVSRNRIGAGAVPATCTRRHPIGGVGSCPRRVQYPGGRKARPLVRRAGAATAWRAGGAWTAAGDANWRTHSAGFFRLCTARLQGRHDDCAGPDLLWGPHHKADCIQFGRSCACYARGIWNEKKGGEATDTRLGGFSERISPRGLCRRVREQATYTRAYDQLVRDELACAARRPNLTRRAFQTLARQNPGKLGYTRLHPVSSCIPVLRDGITHSHQSMFARK